MSRREERGEHLRWLLGACRFWLTGEIAGAAAAEPVDWEARASFCYFHDLDPLLHHLAADSRLGLEGELPARVRRQWEAAYYQNFVFNTELLDLLEAFLDGCRRAGLEVRVFKGPVTLARGWLDPALRIMADADLLCRREDLSGLADIARALDFETGAQTAVHHLVLEHRRLPASLELHFQLYDVFQRPEPILERLWAPPARVEVDGRELPAAAPELAAVLDVAHLLQHDLQLNLKPLLDLSATLWRQRHDLDAGLFRELLDEADLTPEFEVIDTLLTKTLGLPTLPGFTTPSAGPPPELEGALTARLLAPDSLHLVGALAGPHRRGSALGTVRYLLGRIAPPLAQLQAMSGARSRSRALLALPGHALATARRGLARWRKGGVRGGADSLKRRLFERRRSDAAPGG